MSVATAGLIVLGLGLAVVVLIILFALIVATTEGR